MPFRPKSAALQQAMSALLRDERRCSALLASTEAIVWTIHPRDGFVEPQPSWQAYTGQSWEEAKGDGWRAAVHPDDEESIVKQWRRAAKLDEPYHANCRIWHADSREHRNCMIRATPIQDAQGEIVEWVGAVTDVHDRPLNLADMHRVNEALKSQLEAHHAELEHLFSVSLDVMLTLAQDGRLMTVSPSFEVVAGVPAQEARGQVFSAFLHPDDVDRTWAEVRRVLTGTYNAVDFETRLLRPDGQLRIVSWRAVGSPADSRLYAVGRDITDQKKAEQRLIQAQRLEAVGQITGGIAHDFNNLLAALMNYIELAKRQHSNAERQVKSLDAALGAGRRGAKLVSQLMTFAKKQELLLQPTDLNRVVSGMREMLQRTLGGKVHVKTSLAQGLYSALADPTQMEAVLLNLCINARDAMPEGGEVTITTRAHAITDDTNTRRDDLPKGDYVLVRVTDTGFGMDQATLAKCFEPFFTTKGPGSGTGLGLAQVLGFVQQCGGMVKVDSALGAGTSVEVVLPKAEGSTALDADALEAPGPPSLGRGRVLLVDDNEDALTATAELLESFGYEVIRASGPEEAMSVVLSARPFDALLTDFAMPVMTGAELIKIAARHRPKLVAAIVTGFVDEAAIRDVSPGVTILRKPFETQVLVETVSAAIRTHRLKTGEEEPRDRRRGFERTGDRPPTQAM